MKANKVEVKKRRKVERSLRRKLSKEDFDLTEAEIKLLMDRAEEVIVEEMELERTMAL
jgi:hypothetical protein